LGTSVLRKRTVPAGDLPESNRLNVAADSYRQDQQLAMINFTDDVIYKLSIKKRRKLHKRKGKR
jgi:hypothetical protein